MSGWVSRAFTWSLPPWMICRTPSGAPASTNSSVSRFGVIGSCSDGFSTNVLPQATASGNIHRGIMAGKLKGVMPAHTPKGWV